MGTESHFEDRGPCVVPTCSGTPLPGRRYCERHVPELRAPHEPPCDCFDCVANEPERKERQSRLPARPPLCECGDPDHFICPKCAARQRAGMQSREQEPDEIEVPEHLRPDYTGVEPTLLPSRLQPCLCAEVTQYNCPAHGKGSDSRLQAVTSLEVLNVPLGGREMELHYRPTCTCGWTGAVTPHENLATDECSWHEEREHSRLQARHSAMCNSVYDPTYDCNCEVENPVTEARLPACAVCGWAGEGEHDDMVTGTCFLGDHARCQTDGCHCSCHRQEGQQEPHDGRHGSACQPCDAFEHDPATHDADECEAPRRQDDFEEQRLVASLEDCPHRCAEEAERLAEIRVAAERARIAAWVDQRFGAMLDSGDGNLVMTYPSGIEEIASFLRGELQNEDHDRG